MEGCHRATSLWSCRRPWTVRHRRAPSTKKGREKGQKSLILIVTSETVSKFWFRKCPNSDHKILAWFRSGKPFRLGHHVWALWNIRCAHDGITTSSGQTGNMWAKCGHWMSLIQISLVQFVSNLVIGSQNVGTFYSYEVNRSNLSCLFLGPNLYPLLLPIAGRIMRWPSGSWWPCISAWRFWPWDTPAVVWRCGAPSRPSQKAAGLIFEQLLVALCSKMTLTLTDHDNKCNGSAMLDVRTESEQCKPMNEYSPS